jgi:hypothetical protein
LPVCEKALASALGMLDSGAKAFYRKGEAFALFLRSGEPGLRGAHMASP